MNDENFCKKRLLTWDAENQKETEEFDDIDKLKKKLKLKLKNQKNI